MSKKDQRKRVYEWEWQFGDFNRQTLSWKKTKRLIKAACVIFDTPTFPKVVKRKGDDFSRHRQGKIELIKAHWNSGVALHEAAHFIVNQLHGKQDDGGHGKLFMGVYMTLLAHFNILPMTALKASLSEKKVKWSRIKKARH